MPWSDPKPIITRGVSIYGLHTNTIRSVITNPIRSCSGSYCYVSCIQRAEPWMRGTTEKKNYKLCGAYYVHRKYPWHGAKRTCGWLTPRSYIWYAWWRRNKIVLFACTPPPALRYWSVDLLVAYSYLKPIKSYCTNRCLVATPTPLHQNWQTSHLIQDPYTSTSRSLCRSVELMSNIWPFNWRYLCRKLCHSLLCRIVSFSNLLQAAGCLWTQHPLKKILAGRNSRAEPGRQVTGMNPATTGPPTQS
jgi:hypothetical protein